MGELREGLPEAGEAKDRGRSGEAQALILREAIGKRLYEIGNFMRDPIVIPDTPEWEVSGSMNRECWRKLADECIRQMEWARHECCFEWAGTPDEVTLAGSRDAILRIAPDDWKP
jgi:hypothetical protein